MDKNVAKLNTFKLHPRYKHVKYDDGVSATICILETEDKIAVAQGVSLCSVRDNFNKSEGRTISLGRAISAFEHKDNLYPIKRNVICANDAAFKALYLGSK
jgi:hypothetical protein